MTALQAGTVALEHLDLQSRVSHNLYPSPSPFTSITAPIPNRTGVTWRRWKRKLKDVGHHDIRLGEAPSESGVGLLKYRQGCLERVSG